jgi:hypothetical protein
MENVLTIPKYDRSKGAAPPMEGGSMTVELVADGVVLKGDRAGLRDLARWCLALADPDGVHVHLEPAITPLTSRSLALLVERRDAEGANA